MKVGIVIIVFNLDSRIFLLQQEAIKKYCKDDYVVEVFDNSNEPKKSEDIKYHAEILGLKYTRTYSIGLDGSLSHAFSANLSYQHLLQKKYEYLFYLDHDAVPIKYFSVTEILGEMYIAGLGQVRKEITYYWQGCVMFNNEKVAHELIDFSPNPKLGLDTGGNLYKVIEAYGERCKFFDEQYAENPFYHGRYNFYALINNGMFLHCIGASSWNEPDGNEERINSLVTIISEKIGSNVG